MIWLLIGLIVGGLCGLACKRWESGADLEHHVNAALIVCRGDARGLETHPLRIPEQSRLR